MNSFIRTITRTIATIIILIGSAAPAIAQYVPTDGASTNLPIEFRAGKSYGKFVDTSSMVAAYNLPAPRWTRATHLEAAFGSMTIADESHPVFSLGPVWRFPLKNDRTAIRLGFSPTILTATKYEGRDMGGYLHFTSSIAFEFDPGRRNGLVMAFRLQHTSNGGTNSDNPGMDIASVGLEYRPSGRN